MKKDRLLRRYVWMLSEANHTSDYRPNAVKEFMFHNKCKRALAKLQDAGMSTRMFMREEYNNENIESHYNMIYEFMEKGIISSKELQYVMPIDRFVDCMCKKVAGNWGKYETKTPNDDIITSARIDTVNYVANRYNNGEEYKLKDCRNLDVNSICEHLFGFANTHNIVSDRTKEISDYVANKKANAQSKLNKEQIEKANAQRVLSETEKEIIQSNTKNDLMM